jgi:hypothetical protein
VRHPCALAALFLQSTHLPPLALATPPPSCSPCSEHNHWFRRPKLPCTSRRSEMLQDAAQVV